ncbi:iron dicitrate transport regulator FecR [Bradyrhizobium sp. Leo170]|nr:iron dicitrate transport regulator FecR [Bradyrhizobium sp. Leo170]
MDMATDIPPGNKDNKSLERDAIVWLTRVTDEDVTAEDRAALRHWLAQSPDHAEAFAKANTLWRAMPSAIETMVRSGSVSLPAPAEMHRGVIGRRTLIGGLATATAAAACYAMFRPPLDLWPSLSELAADYRTATGEQRQITVADGISVQMNTQTSIALRPAATSADRFELLSGEAIIGAASIKPVQVIAADGLTSADAAKFNIRCSTAKIVVTCLSGSVHVEHRDHAATLREKQQVAYGGGMMSNVDLVDLATVTSWQDGYLVFRNEPLADVIAEVNRYRPGRIVLLDAELGRGLVTARFRLDRLDDVVVQVRDVFGARIRTLAAGIVLVG